MPCHLSVKTTGHRIRMHTAPAFRDTVVCCKNVVLSNYYLLMQIKKPRKLQGSQNIVRLSTKHIIS